MALLLPGAPLGGLSGKVGAMVFSRNRYGAYARSRVTPVNRNTPLQVSRRAGLSAAAIAWKLCTDAQREAWNNYATNTPVVNRVGIPVVLTGQAMFVRTNSMRRLADLSILSDAPVVPGLASLGVVTSPGNVESGSDRVILTLSGGSWNSAGGVIFAFASRPLANTVNFFKGPFQLSLVNDNTGGSLTSIEVPLATSSAEVGTKFFVRVVAIDADGRMSPEQIFALPVTA